MRTRQLMTAATTLTAALLCGSFAIAQTSTDTPDSPKKPKDTSGQVQVTTDTNSKHHCRDTDVKAADGRLPAQTTMNGRLRNSQADCKADAPKPVAPDSKGALKDSVNQSSVPPNDKG